MPLYCHGSGERVLTSAESAEGRRLDADSAWGVDEPPGPAPTDDDATDAAQEPRGRRGHRAPAKSAEDGSGEHSATETPSGDDAATDDAPTDTT